MKLFFENRKECGHPPCPHCEDWCDVLLRGDATDEYDVDPCCDMQCSYVAEPMFWWVEERKPVDEPDPLDPPGVSQKAQTLIQELRRKYDDAQAHLLPAMVEHLEILRRELSELDAEMAQEPPGRPSWALYPFMPPPVDKPIAIACVADGGLRTVSGRFDGTSFRDPYGVEIPWATKEARWCLLRDLGWWSRPDPKSWPDARTR